MRRHIVRWLLCLALIVTCYPLPAGLAALPRVTVLLYASGSSLEAEEGAISFNLEQMLAAPDSEQVTLLLQAGGSSWHNDYIADGHVQRFVRDGDAFTPTDTLQNANIGAADTLEDFIVWGTQYAPADRYILIFLGHGLGSIGGFGVDSNHVDGQGMYSGDTLTLPEMHLGLSNAFDRTGLCFDLIGFDCCLMASLETAQTCAPFGSILVASQADEPQYGWDYGALLATLAQDPGIDAEALGAAIADHYDAQCLRYGLDGDATLSVIRLAAIPRLTQALDSLAQRAHESFVQAPDHFYAIAQRATRAKAYGGLTATEGYADMIDLGDLATCLADLYHDEAVAMHQALAMAVAYQVNGWQQQSASGLSVYMPMRDRAFFNESLRVYSDTQASGTYKAFVNAWAEWLSVSQLDQQTESLFTSEIELNAQTGFWQASLNTALSVHIQHAFAVLATPYQGERLLLLGQRGTVSIDAATGLVQGAFPEAWLTLDGQFVMPEIVEVTDDAIVYAIPALLDGSLISLRASYNIADNRYQLHGYRLGDSVTLHDAGLRQLESGQTLTPLFRLYDIMTGDTQLAEGQVFELSDIQILQDAALPSGEYALQLGVRDVLQSLHYTDFGHHMMP